MALIIVHGISFANRQIGSADLSSLPAFSLLFFLAGLNGLFLLLAGVAFRLQIRDSIHGNRIMSGAGSGIGTTLVVLILVELLKNLAIYHTPVTLLTWDFLRTLLLSWIVLYWVGRLNIYFILVPVVVLSCGFNFFYPTLRGMAWAIQDGLPDLRNWNSFHDQALIFVGALLSWLGIRVWRQPVPRLIKLGATALITGLFFYFTQILAKYTTPNLTTYSLGRNWWLYGFIGDPAGHGLFPLGVWAPSVWLGFIATHFALTRKLLFDRVSAISVIFASSAACLLLGYVWFARHWNWFADQVGSTMWNFSYGLETGFSFDVLKLALAVLVFSVFWFMNSHLRLKLWSRTSDRLSRGTFWIYVGTTGWTAWFAGKLSQFADLKLTWAMVLNVGSGLLLALVLARLIESISSVRLHVRLKRWSE